MTASGVLSWWAMSERRSSPRGWPTSLTGLQAGSRRAAELVDEAHERQGEVGVEPPARPGLELPPGVVQRQRAAVRTVVRHRVEGVHEREDTRRQRDLLLPQPARVAGSVPPLVMGAYDLAREVAEVG